MPAMTLREVNHKLTSVGLPAIDRNAKNKLAELAEKDILIKAINRTADDPNAVTFLARLFAKAGISANAPVMPSGSRRAASPRESTAAPISSTGSPSSKDGQVAPTPIPNREGSKGAFLSYHTYGGKAALSWEADIGRKGDVATVAIDGAMAMSERRYDWPNKLRVQITQSELPVVTAVFIGVLEGCEYGQHGSDNTKGFSLQRQQGGKVFARIFAKNEPIRAVPIEAPDAFQVAALLVRQMRKNMPWLDATGVIDLLRATVKDYAPPKPSQ